MEDYERECVGHLRGHEGLEKLTSAALCALWHAWSDEVYSAGWMDYTPRREAEFVEWALG